MKESYRIPDHTESSMSEMRDMEVPADDDSQQAAEAMVQLGNVGFYTGEQPLLLQQGTFKICISFSPKNKSTHFLQCEFKTTKLLIFRGKHRCRPELRSI